MIHWHIDEIHDVVFFYDIHTGLRYNYIRTQERSAFFKKLSKTFAKLKLRDEKVYFVQGMAKS